MCHCALTYWSQVCRHGSGCGGGGTRWRCLPLALAERSLALPYKSLLMTLHPLQLFFGTHAAALLHGLPRVQPLQGTLWSLLGDSSGRVNNAETNRTKEQCGEREIKERNVNNLQKRGEGKRKGEKRETELPRTQPIFTRCLSMPLLYSCCSLTFFACSITMYCIYSFFCYLHFRSKVCSEYSTFVIKWTFISKD